MRAWCAIRKGPLYRHEAFVAGLKAIGCEVREGYPAAPDQCDLLVMWNRYDVGHQIASRVEKCGGTVLVAENGYLGFGGSSPKFDMVAGRSDSTFALARGGHNGQGWTPDGTGRFEQLGVDVKPWRPSGRHVLVCANRSFGIPGRMMPMTWPSDVAAQLRSIQKRPVVLRNHPGNDAPKRPLAQDLANAWAVVVWSSSAGAHALAAGIPVLCAAPFWILKAASGRLDEVDAPPRPERGPHFERLAWAQWTLEEIASGRPYRLLLEKA